MAKSYPLISRISI